MLTITDNELENDFEKYNEIAKSEEIIVTVHGKPAYVLEPARDRVYKEAMSLVGILPKDTTIGIDPDERG